MPVPARRVTPETFVAAFVCAFAALMAVGYLLDAAGLPIPPAVLGLAFLGAALAAFAAFQEPSAAPPGSTALFAIVVACALGYFLWLASPSLLPVTNGPDIVHHLLLIHVIQRTHHLVHGDALGPPAGNDGPGSHLAAPWRATGSTGSASRAASDGCLWQ